MDIVSAVIKSTPEKHTNIPEVTGWENGKPLVPIYDWKSFFHSYFRPIDQINSRHHFRFTKESKQTLFYRNFCDSTEVQQPFLKDLKKIPLGMPSLITPKGLSLERQYYLHTEIRRFCREGTEDLVCPYPKFV